MSIFVLLADLAFGPQTGPCQVCGQDGKRKQSIVDPGPHNKILCSVHWKEYICANKCSVCGQNPTYASGNNIFLCKAHS